VAMPTPSTSFVSMVAMVTPLLLNRSCL